MAHPTTGAADTERPDTTTYTHDGKTLVVTNPDDPAAMELRIVDNTTPRPHSAPPA